ncbi:hypothetical protein ARMSODRAFT_981594 [Armillaria solidipes]|uniref:Uncharacterized protein n=1 Tax=Armillaria solidipes TaxID=1076256 RepID=A0A2H3AR26_9AGAR|nr:hypothetical protein ARMSODRAFT_981594 [Armillaria solidipes]
MGCSPTHDIDAILRYRHNSTTTLEPRKVEHSDQPFILFTAGSTRGIPVPSHSAFFEFPGRNLVVALLGPCPSAMESCLQKKNIQNHDILRRQSGLGNRTPVAPYASAVAPWDSFKDWVDTVLLCALGDCELGLGEWTIVMFGEPHNRDGESNPGASKQHSLGQTSIRMIRTHTSIKQGGATHGFALVKQLMQKRDPQTFAHMTIERWNSTKWGIEPHEAATSSVTPSPDDLGPPCAHKVVSRGTTTAEMQYLCKVYGKQSISRIAWIPAFRETLVFMYKHGRRSGCDPAKEQSLYLPPGIISLCDEWTRSTLLGAIWALYECLDSRSRNGRHGESLLSCFGSKDVAFAEYKKKISPFFWNELYRPNAQLALSEELVSALALLPWDQDVSDVTWHILTSCWRGKGQQVDPTCISLTGPVSIDGLTGRRVTPKFKASLRNTSVWVIASPFIAGRGRSSMRVNEVLEAEAQESPDNGHD